MPDAALQTTDLIIGRGILTAESIAQELRDRLVREIAEGRVRLTDSEILALARRVLDEFEPLLAQSLTEAELAGWIAGLDRVSKVLPAGILADLAAVRGIGIPPILPPFIFPPAGAFGEDEPLIELPLIERAAESLRERNIVTREQFDQLTDEAKARAFTVAGEQSLDALDTIRQLLADDIERGTSLRSFRNRVREAIEGSEIGPAHLENVYRTNVQAAFSDGHETLASNPVVEEVFPYQEILPIDDGRTREDHLALASLGLNGTGVFRRDDPMWRLFTPPWGYQCRCGVNLLTIDAAARRGVVEASLWESSGEPPANPEHRLQFIPFRPEPGFVGGRRGVTVRLAFDESKVNRDKGQFAEKEGSGAEDKPKPKRAKQTATPEFKAWFGDSKVVDEDGEPLVLFHGTADSFDQFTFQDLGDDRKEAAFFSDNPDVAAGYAQHQSLAEKKILRRLEVAETEREEYGQRLFDRDDASMPERENALIHGLNELFDDKAISQDEYDKFWELDEKVDGIQSEEVGDLEDERKPQLKPTYLQMKNPRVVDAKGASWEGIVPSILKSTDRTKYDGIIWKNVKDNPGGAEFASTTYAVFQPTQIKSASGNRGTFDPKDPNITMAVHA